MPDFDSVPPHSVEAETAVLGAMMGSADAAGVAAEMLAADAFYTERHRALFAALREVRDDGLAGDAVVVVEALRARGKLDALGGSEYLADVFAKTPGFANVERYCRIVREHASRRAAAELAAGFHRRVAEDGHDLAGVIRETREKLDALAEEVEPEDDLGPRLAWAAPQELDEREPESVVDGLLLAGMLNLLHAVDKVGKSIFALELARATLTGRPAFGEFEVRRRGPVLLAAIDDPECITKQRLRLAGIQALAPSRLAVLTPGRVDLADPEAFLEAVEADAFKLKPALVVLDALYLLSPAGEGALNDAAVVRPLMSRVEAVAARSGAAVLLVHHDRRDASSYAGSYAIRAMSKHALHLAFPRAKDGRADEESPRRELKVVSKLMPASRHAFELTGPCAWSYLGSAGAVREADLDGRVVDAVRAAGAPLSGAEVAEEVGTRRVAVLAAVKRLAVEGRLHTEDVRPERGGKPTKKYSIPVVPKAGNDRERPALRRGSVPVVPPKGGGTTDSDPPPAPERSGTTDRKEAEEGGEEEPR